MMMASDAGDGDRIFLLCLCMNKHTHKEPQAVWLFFFFSPFAHFALIRSLIPLAGLSMSRLLLPFDSRLIEYWEVLMP